MTLTIVRNNVFGIELTDEIFTRTGYLIFKESSVHYTFNKIKNLNFQEILINSVETFRYKIIY